uniref:Uncharacterized protein n=1 Tax=Chrysemys picta bellii TaxID=8478 RepID=A0A8C3IS87_CHRPI
MSQVQVLPYGEDKLGHYGEVGQISFTCRLQDTSNFFAGGQNKRSPQAAAGGRSAEAREVRAGLPRNPPGILSPSRCQEYAGGPAQQGFLLSPRLVAPSRGSLHDLPKMELPRWTCSLPDRTGNATGFALSKV